MGAAAVAGTEHQSLAVVELRYGAGICGGAQHHVAVQGFGKVERRGPVQRQLEQPDVACGAGGPTRDDQRRAVGGPGDTCRETVGGPDAPGRGVGVVGVDDVRGRSEDQVAVIADRGGESQCFAVRGPRRWADVPRLVRQLPALPRRQVEHVHLGAHGLQEPGAVGLVVESVDN